MQGAPRGYLHQALSLGLVEVTRNHNGGNDVVDEACLEILLGTLSSFVRRIFSSMVSTAFPLSMVYWFSEPCVLLSLLALNYSRKKLPPPK